MAKFTKGTFAHYTVVGNVGKKELVRVPYNGEELPVLRLQIGVNVKNGKEQATWIPVSVAGKRAEKLDEIISVGDKILAEGAITANTWETQSGTKRKKFNFQANNIVFLKTKNAANANAQEQAEEPVPNFEDGEEDEVPF